MEGIKLDLEFINSIYNNSWSIKIFNQEALVFVNNLLGKDFKLRKIYSITKSEHDSIKSFPFLITITSFKMKNILFIVDPQNDFIEGGNLPVNGSFNKMCNLSGYLSKLEDNDYDLIIVSLDWHPINHCSFQSLGGSWPEHCVEYTHGSMIFQPILFNLMRFMEQDKVVFIRKGEDKNKEEYSSVNERTLEQFKTLINPSDTIDICGIVGTVCVWNTIKGLVDLCISHSSNITAMLDYTAQFNESSETELINNCKIYGVNYD